MINVGRKDISRIEASDKNGIQRSIGQLYVYINGELKLIWEAIKSCFGSGFWINNRSWINNNAWKNK